MSSDWLYGSDLQSYRLRMLSGIVMVELLMLALVTLWPAEEQTEEPLTLGNRQEQIYIEDILITEQSNAPAPPRPFVPMPQPSDETVEEVIVTLDPEISNQLTDLLAMKPNLGRVGRGEDIVSSPQRSASVTKIVEPVVPDAFRNKGEKAEIWVTFLVNADGSVEEAHVSKIRKFDHSQGKWVTTEAIGYGLVEATLEAAVKWRFRPAEDGGQKVRTYSEQIFSFGF